MSDVEREQFITEAVYKWRHKLFLTEWNIDVVQSKEEDTSPPGGTYTLADVHVIYPYKKATITIYPQFWHKDDETKEQALVHELCHCHTQDVWDVINSQHNGCLYPPHVVTDIIETLTQRMAIIAHSGDK